MKELRYTLVSDGSSDRALIPTLNWILRQHTVGVALQPAWADLRRLPKPPRNLAKRIRFSMELYPCDLLFIHRDAEGMQHSHRVQEIEQALAGLTMPTKPRAICVVPVRMTEAWLLFNKAAMRRAAGNPNGRESLQLPSLSQLERLPDPKSVLHDLLKRASGRTGRQLKKFQVNVSVHMVAEYTSDFSPLRALPAFKALEYSIEEAMTTHGGGVLC